MRYSKRIGILLLIPTFALLAACATHLTPKVQAYDLNSKWRGVQDIIAEVVSQPQLPSNAKTYIKATEKTITLAANAYTHAVEQGNADAPALLNNGLQAILDLVQYLVKNGLISATQAAKVSDILNSGAPPVAAILHHNQAQVAFLIGR